MFDANQENNYNNNLATCIKDERQQRDEAAAPTKPHQVPVASPYQRVLLAKTDAVQLVFLLSLKCSTTLMGVRTVV